MSHILEIDQKVDQECMTLERVIKNELLNSICICIS